MSKPISVKSLAGFKIYVKYDDGLEGELNMNKMVQRDEYKSLSDPEEFRKVFIDKKTKDIMWESGASVCKVATHNMLLLKKEMEGIGLNVENNN